MTRPKPSIDVPTIAPKQGDVVKQVRKYRLITPLFGGGVSAGYPDEVRPIRGSSLRGQLRFWWRATRGGRFNGNLQEMKEAEQALWGAAATTTSGGPSQVNLEVIVAEDESGELVAAFDKNNRYRPTSVAPAYAAFPLQPEQEARRQNADVPPLLDGVKFSLSLTWPKKHSREIEAALWAWETFGGIGARTRRGFGAVELIELDGKAAPSPKSIDHYLAEGLKTHVATGSWPDGVAHLDSSTSYKVFPGKWKALVEKYMSFRQSRRKSRDPGARHPGRSYWPEPDAIRRITDQRSRRHEEDLSEINKFPRAAFGLPIIFHFKDGDDPSDTELKGRDQDRLASPLLLRPLPYTNGAQSVALKLQTEGTIPPLSDLILNKSGFNANQQHQLTTAEASHVRPLKGNPDVIEAFLKSL